MKRGIVSSTQNAVLAGGVQISTQIIYILTQDMLTQWVDCVERLPHENCNLVMIDLNFLTS